MPFLLDAIQIWIYYLGLFVSQGVGVSFRCFHGAFPIMRALTPQARELIWKFYQILSYVLPVAHLRIRDITALWVADPVDFL